MAARARVGYLGPEGTFSEEALLASVSADVVEPVALPTIYDTVMAVRHGAVDWALVPIENSLDGSVTITLDTLASEAEALQIVGEQLLSVKHSLIAREQLELAEIDTVLSHPQVPGQCTEFLRAELPHANVLPASSTAEAVRVVANGSARTTAALGTRLAAEIYGATVIRADVQDRDDNETRFVWLARGRAGASPSQGDGDGDGDANSDNDRRPPLRSAPGEHWKTSLVFWGPGADSPGWLVRCLDEFARRQINLTKIESRPRREQMGHYMFFVDLEGQLRDDSVGNAVARVRELCEQAHVLGSYPSA